MPTIPFFTPPFSAATLRCQLCGKDKPTAPDNGNPQIGDQEFVTERVRGIQLRAEQGDFNFCRPCSAIAAEIGQKIEGFRARVLADAERQIADELAQLVPQWIAEKTGAPVPDAAPKKAAKPPKRTPSMIPEPRGS